MCLVLTAAAVVWTPGAGPRVQNALSPAGPALAGAGL